MLSWQRWVDLNPSINPDRNQNKGWQKRWRERVALTTWAGSMWSPVCWLVGFEATGFGWGDPLWLLASQLASQPVSWHAPDEVSDPHHMKGVWDWLEMVARESFNGEKCIIIIKKTKPWLKPKTFSSFVSLLLFSKLWLVSMLVGKHRGNRNKRKKRNIPSKQLMWEDW